MTMTIDLLDKFKGCMVGLAAGDALGMPVEGFTAEEIKRSIGAVRDMMPAPEKHFHYSLQAGQYTDDTQETLLLAESIVEATGFSLDKFTQKLIEWGTAWILDDRLDRGVGFTTKSSIEKLITGTSWMDSGLSIPTCGSAMRVAPIGLVYHCDLNIVARYADLQCIPTHSSSAARAGTIAMAIGVALCLKSFPREIILRTASAFAGKVDKEFAERLLRVGSILDLEPDTAMYVIGNSPDVSESVPAAFYYFLKFGPEDALIAAASSGGDTDSIASMAGALFGAERGSHWIPRRWSICLEGYEHLERVAENLFKLSNLLCGI